MRSTGILPVRGGAAAPARSFTTSSGSALPPAVGLPCAGRPCHYSAARLGTCAQMGTYRTAHRKVTGRMAPAMTNRTHYPRNPGNHPDAAPPPAGAGPPLDRHMAGRLPARGRAGRRTPRNPATVRPCPPPRPHRRPGARGHTRHTTVTIAPHRAQHIYSAVVGGR